MKKTAFITLFLTMTLFGIAQENWFGFNRFKADNEHIIANGEFPEVVFMGNSITEYWALYHPEFFREHNYCGRGIGGQTSAQMLLRFTSDVINLHPKAVVIMAGTNDVAHNTYWVEPQHRGHVRSGPRQRHCAHHQLHPALRWLCVEPRHQGRRPNHR